jgi:hypothetical protein
MTECLLQCGENEESLKVIERAIEINPNDDINGKIRDRLLKKGGTL